MDLSFAGWTSRLVPLGRCLRNTPLRFSLLPRCHGECASAKYTGTLSSRDSSLSSEAKMALVYAHRHGYVTNEDLRVLLPKLDAKGARVTLRGLVAAGLAEPTGRGRGMRYVLTGPATRSRATTLQVRVDTVVSHARRAGFILIQDVQALLGITDAQARDLVEAAVAGGLLSPEGFKSARRYVPVDQEPSQEPGG